MKTMSHPTAENTAEITAESIAAVVAAIKGTGPRVDRETFRAHVPKFVTRTGVIVETLAAEISGVNQPKPTPEPEACPHLTKALEAIRTLGEIEVPEIPSTESGIDLFDEIRQSPQFEPLIAAYLNRNWIHFRAHTSALMGDFDPDYDCHVGEPNGLVDRFFTVVYGIDTQLVPTLTKFGHNPTPSVALVIGLVVAGDTAGSAKWSPLTAATAEPLLAADLGK